MTELKPCPFCGGTDIHIEYETDDYGNETWSYICCYDCLSSFFQQEACCAEDNVKAWNRRAKQEPDDTLKATAEGILGMLQTATFNEDGES